MNNLRPGECVIEDYGNQILIGPCPSEASVLVLLSGGGLGLVFALAIAVWLNTEIEYRRQRYRRVIRLIKSEL